MHEEGRINDNVIFKVDKKTIKSLEKQTLPSQSQCKTQSIIFTHKPSHDN